MCGFGLINVLRIKISKTKLGCTDLFNGRIVKLGKNLIDNGNMFKLVPNDVVGSNKFVLTVCTISVAIVIDGMGPANHH